MFQAHLIKDAFDGASIGEIPSIKGFENTVFKAPISRADFEGNNLDFSIANENYGNSYIELRNKYIVNYNDSVAGTLFLFTETEGVRVLRKGIDEAHGDFVASSIIQRVTCKMAGDNHSCVIIDGSSFYTKESGFEIIKVAAIRGNSDYAFVAFKTKGKLHLLTMGKSYQQVYHKAIDGLILTHGTRGIDI